MRALPATVRRPTGDHAVTYWTQSPGPMPAPTRRAHRGWWVFVTVLVVAVVVEALVGLALAPRALVAVTMARYTNAIVWTECDDDLYCGRIDAPLDWSDPASPAIQLALVEHRATGTRTGTLVVDPGGPGGSGVDMVASDVRNAVTSTVAAHDDVIGIDPRGVGSSTAVQCGGASALDALLYPGVTGTVGSDAWIRGERAAAAAFARSCERHTGALLAHVDTVSAARDLELVRRDLGVDRLDYLGYSYGTQLGSVFAGLYPHSVGRFVLDGAIDLWSDEDADDSGDGDDAGDGGQAAGFETALRDWMKACIAGAADAVPSGATCPYRGDVDSGMADVRALLARVSSAPLRGSDGRALDGGTLATAISSALYDEHDWPTLTVALTDATAGKADHALGLADQYNGRDEHGHYDGNSTEAFTAVQCRDFGGGEDVADMRRYADDLRKSAPTLGPYQAFDFTCDQWPVPATSDWPAPPTAAGDGPVLVVGTTKDPATPYHDAQQLADLFPDGHLVTEHGEGHTAYDLGDHCVDDVVDAYLLHGKVPAHDPDCRP
jgi:pimeloyl-ACP methyl ester carboxylesterase